jgi:hypothetical protein
MRYYTPVNFLNLNQGKNTTNEIKQLLRIVLYLIKIDYWLSVDHHNSIKMPRHAVLARLLKPQRRVFRTIRSQIWYKLWPLLYSGDVVSCVNQCWMNRHFSFAAHSSHEILTRQRSCSFRNMELWTNPSRQILSRSLYLTWRITNEGSIRTRITGQDSPPSRWWWVQLPLELGRGLSTKFWPVPNFFRGTISFMSSYFSIWLTSLCAKRLL